MKAAQPSITTYLKTWAALLALLALTIFAAHFDLGFFGLPVALLIALTQAALVVLFFMHLHYSKAEVVVVACAGYFWLGILLVGTLHDYLTRNWIPGQPAHGQRAR